MSVCCLTCKEELQFHPGKGWSHLNGGGLICVRCPLCGYKRSPDPTPKACPNCGARTVEAERLRDDHVGVPERSR
jgi:ssDNA-binding Zn-finger/Zn-ribbon topoisomerase 1